MHAHLRRRSLVTIISLVGLASACNSDEVLPEGLEEGTGIGTEDGGDDGNPYHPCLQYEEEGETRLRWQCDGNLAFTFEGEVLGDPEDFSDEFFFGDGWPDDSYYPPEGPKVMACCDDGTSALNFWKACMWDLITQGCFELYHEIDEQAMMQGLGQLEKKNLRLWIANNFSDCREVFWTTPGIKDLGAIDSDAIDGLEWELPSCPNAGDSRCNGYQTDATGWPHLDNPVLRIDEARTDGTPYAPSTPDECLSAEDNDDVTFQGQEGAGLDVYWPLSGGADLDGPNSYAGSGNLSSEATYCDTSCSSLTYSTNAVGTKTIETINIYSSGGATVSNGTTTYDVDYFTAKMLSPATIQNGLGGTKFIPIGKAKFVVTAHVEGLPQRLAGHPTNDVKIYFSFGSYALTTSTFTATYTDSQSNAWVLTVDELDWEAEPPT